MRRGLAGIASSMTTSPIAADCCRLQEAFSHMNRCKQAKGTPLTYFQRLKNTEPNFAAIHWPSDCLQHFPKGFEDLSTRSRTKGLIVRRDICDYL